MKTAGTRQIARFSSKPTFFYDFIKEFIVEIISDILHVRMASADARPGRVERWTLKVES